MNAGAKPKQEQGAVEAAVRFWLPVIIVVLVVRTFLFQPFHIPSGSMMATLLVGDSLFVSKFSYGYSRYSLMFSPPIFSGRIFASLPRRGDIVVFRSPHDDDVDLIKRIIGLPGDRIQVIGGHLHLNGEPVPRERIEDFVDTDVPEGAVRIHRWRETLPGGVSYATLDLVGSGLVPSGPLQDTQVYQVPPGHYFMMGDNRDDSTDSRVLDEVGYVPFENIVGRAEIIYFSIGDGAAAWQIWRWPTALRLRRFFSIIR
jgi:signal peptidase I